MVERAYHHGNLRSALLDRAERTVRERGVDALSLRELARDVGVSHGAPRRHFPDRGALLDAVAQSGWERLARELDASVATVGPGAEARLQALARAYVEFATRDAALLELMFAIKHRDGAEGVRAEADRSLAIALEVVAAAQRSGELVSGDAQQITQFVFATLHGLATMANGGMLGDEDVHEVVTEAIERLMSGLRPRPPHHDPHAQPTTGSDTPDDARTNDDSARRILEAMPTDHAARARAHRGLPAGSSPASPPPPQRSR